MLTILLKKKNTKLLNINFSREKGIYPSPLRRKFVILPFAIISKEDSFFLSKKY